jgi:hypothetical protein
MIADPKRKLHEGDPDHAELQYQEEMLDEALRNTFPASDPISVEQPTTIGRVHFASPATKMRGAFPPVLSRTYERG